MGEVDEMVQCSQVDRSTGFIGQHRGVAEENLLVLGVLGDFYPSSCVKA